MAEHRHAERGEIRASSRYCGDAFDGTPSHHDHGNLHHFGAPFSHFEILRMRAWADIAVRLARKQEIRARFRCLHAIMAAAQTCRAYHSFWRKPGNSILQCRPAQGHDQSIRLCPAHDTAVIGNQYRNAMAMSRLYQLLGKLLISLRIQIAAEKERAGNITGSKGGFGLDGNADTRRHDEDKAAPLRLYRGMYFFHRACNLRFSGPF